MFSINIQRMIFKKFSCFKIQVFNNLVILSFIHFMDIDNWRLRVTSHVKLSFSSKYPYCKVYTKEKFWMPAKFEN